MKPEWTLKEISEWAKDDSKVKIPAIQRGLVWKPHQVELLWDSILRQFPIGAFILSRKEKMYDLIDGQQRWNAIALGYGASDENCILWFDLKPENIWKKSYTTRKYFIRATTKAHPWGYKANDDCATLNTAQKRAALQEFGVNDNEYEGMISLAETYPIESGLPIPLYWMIAAGEEHSEDKDGFVKYIMDKIEENKVSRMFKLKEVVEINGSLIAKYHKAFSRLLCYKVPTICVDQEIIDKESEDKGGNGDLSGIEILFNRIGTGGTRITQSELMYSAVKAYWPELTKENDRLAKRYMPPHTLISLAFQLVLSTTDNGLERAPTVEKIRKLAGDECIRTAIYKLYLTDGNDSLMSRILSSVDQWLTNYDKIPKVLRTTIARDSPEVYLLLMTFAKWKEEGQIDTKPEEEVLFRAMGYYIHWMVDDKFGVANSIYKVVAESELSKWRNIIKQVLLVSCVKGTITPLLSPEAFRGLFTVEGDKYWRPYGNGRAVMPWWPLWNTVVSNKEILLYAQRKYMCRKFPLYDPARQDLWEGQNRPWDFDHIIPQDWVHKKGKWKKWREYTDYCEAWKNNNGNMAAIPFWVNRAKSNEANWDEYKDNTADLLADEQIPDFGTIFNEKLSCERDQAKRFAEKTFARMCRIYDEVYALLKPVDFRAGGVTFSEEGGIKKRIDRMTCICDRLKNEGFAAGIYYLYGNTEYPQENIDDWTRTWMSCGCVTKNNYYAAFTMALRSDGSLGDIEIGLRRLPQKAELTGEVTNEQLRKLERHETYELLDNSPWWHIYKEISVDTDKDEIINELKALENFASHELQ